MRGPVRKTAQWDHIAGTAQWISHAYVVSKANFPVCAPPPTTRSPVAFTPTRVPAGPTGTLTNAHFLAASIGPAQQSQREFKVPASVSLAQAILESGWGRSKLSTNDRNFFGMKCFSQGAYANGCRTYVTSECDATTKICYGTTASFRTYASSANSFRDHGALRFNNVRYRAALNSTANPKHRVAAPAHRRRVGPPHLRRHRRGTGQLTRGDPVPQPPRGSRPDSPAGH